MHRRRSKLGGRSCQRLVRLLESGELDHLTSGEMAKVLRNDASMAKKFAPFVELNELDPNAISQVIESRPDLIAHVSDYHLRAVDANVWVRLVKNDPTAIAKMPRSPANLAALVVAGLGKICGSDDFSGSTWSSVVLSDPRCITYCEVRKMTEADWLALYPVRGEIMKCV